MSVRVVNMAAHLIRIKKKYMSPRLFSVYPLVAVEEALIAVGVVGGATDWVVEEGAGTQRAHPAVNSSVQFWWKIAWHRDNDGGKQAKEGNCNCSHDCRRAESVENIELHCF